MSTRSPTHASPPGVIAYVALGSNLGDRQAAIDRAVAALAQTPQIEVVAISSIIETQPMGRVDQPRFLNAVARLSTTLSARRLLDVCLEIERRLGRNRLDSQRWGPRLIDLDLLLYGDQTIDEPGLQVPHPRLTERIFVLEPLAEIAGDVLHPVSGASIQSHLERLRDDSLECRQQPARP